MPRGSILSFPNIAQNGCFSFICVHTVISVVVCRLGNKSNALVRQVLGSQEFGYW
uniref:Uncharacterized protein n=1 Tax=Arundo donax TaxID=35708 RepID=A0A0A8ZC82_ARUDO